jgi:high-affinity Fe2+/Pb2+ permease
MSVKRSANWWIAGIIVGALCAIGFGFFLYAPVLID